MFGFFDKTTPDEKRRIDLYSRLVQQVPDVNRFSYRKKGRFEIIFNDTIGDMTDPENQAKFNLLTHAWIIIWGNDAAELHVGATNMLGGRIELNASRLYVGHKFDDHDNMLDGLLSLVGLTRTEMI